MNTRDFITALNPYPSYALVFEVDGKRIKPGYHVTEIKAVSIRGMDCGGRGDAWGETVIQLWTPETKDDYMSVGKFWGIYRRVTPHIPVEEEAEVRLEYGEQGAPAIRYLVTNIRAEHEEVIVSLEPPLVRCKAVERQDFGSAQHQVDGLAVADAASNCCTPASAQKVAEKTTCCG